MPRNVTLANCYARGRGVDGQYKDWVFLSSRLLFHDLLSLGGIDELYPLSRRSIMLNHCSILASALALALVYEANGQNISTPGPAWVQSDYATSPPVYPSRKYKSREMQWHTS